MARAYYDVVTQTDNNPWLLLCGAIIRTAMEDLKKAIEYNDKGQICALKRWFLSDYGQFLSFNQGQYLIDEVIKSCGRG